jgi:hypothetical protein
MIRNGMSSDFDSIPLFLDPGNITQEEAICANIKMAESPVESSNVKLMNDVKAFSNFTTIPWKALTNKGKSINKRKSGITQILTN